MEELGGEGGTDSELGIAGGGPWAYGRAAAAGVGWGLEAG